MNGDAPKSRSQRLTLRDARDVFRLIGEICELGAYPVTWQRHMLTRLGELTDSRMCMAIQSRPPMINPVLATIVNMVDVGFGDEGLRMMDRYAFHGGAMIDPCMTAIMPLFMAGRWFARTRRELVPDDRSWYGSEFFAQYCEPQRIDDLVASNVFLPGPRGCHSINLRRDRNHPTPYSLRERRRVQLFHTELGRLWFKPSRLPDNHIPARLRQTREAVERSNPRLAASELVKKTKPQLWRRMREHVAKMQLVAMVAAKAAAHRTQSKKELAYAR